MADDSELLGQYVELRSEAAFAALVDRHLGSVYHAALRRSGGRRALAQDVAQEVFVALSHHAAALRRHSSLAGWLYVTTRNTTAAMLRREQRRQLREEMAAMNDADTPDPDWDRLRPQLYGALDALPAPDRDAVLLRYFHHRAFADIGATFGLTEEAARKRVERALARLRDQFTRRGIISTAGALGSLLSAEAAEPVPAGLSHAVVSAAAATGGSGAGSAVGAVHFMGAKTIVGTAGLLGLAGLLILPAIGIAVYKHARATAAEARLASAEFEVQPQTALLKKLTANETAVAAEIAHLQRSVEQTRAALAAVPPASETGASRQTPLDQQLADGAKFLATFPQAKAMLMELARQEIDWHMAGFYRLAGLTQAQIDEYETRTVDLYFRHFALSPPNAPHSTVTSLPDDQLKQIFGEAGFEKWQEYQRSGPAYGTASAAATQIGLSARPLSADQVTALAQIVAANNGEYQSGGKVDELSTDWDAVASQARKILSPEQYTAFQAILLQKRFQAALNQARNAAGSVVAKGNP